MSSDYKLISTDVIPNLTTVRFYDETIEHIKSQHPEVPVELPSVLSAVEKCIVSPTFVERSHTSSYVYVDTQSTNKSGDPLRVPVKVIEGTSGVIKSAYFASKEGPVEIVYPEADDQS